MIDALIGLKRKIIEIETYKSYGIAILKNGEKIEIGCLFRYFRDIWETLNRGEFDEDAQKIMSNNGTVISNGIISIDVMDISAMIDLSAENEIEERREKFEKGIKEKKFVDIDSAIFQLTRKNMENINDENDDDDEED